jgi:hypothetical protein
VDDDREKALQDARRVLPWSVEALEYLTIMTEAQDFSIKVQSEDPQKEKEKPKDEQPGSSASSKPAKDKKDGEELVRVQLSDQS